MTSKLLLGDYKEWIGELEYDYLFTSPPDFEEIGIDPSKPDLYQDFLIEVFSAAKPKSNAVTVAFTDRKYNGTIVPKSSILKHSMSCLGYKLLTHKIWVKSDKVDLYRLTYGNVMTFGKGKVKQYMSKEFKPDVWFDGYGEKYKKYSYGMPISIAKRCILNYTKENDIVYDPFMGSGTTAVACIRSDRQYYGSELLRKTYLLSLERIADERNTVIGHF